MLTRNRFRQQRPVEGPPQLPDYSRLRGSGQEAGELREQLAQELDTALQEGGDHADWQELCTVSHEVALGVLGAAGRPHPIPWLSGHEQDKKAMDDAISALLDQRWRVREAAGEEPAEAEAAEIERLSGLLKRGRRDRSKAMRRWEAD